MEQNNKKFGKMKLGAAKENILGEKRISYCNTMHLSFKCDNNLPSNNFIFI